MAFPDTLPRKGDSDNNLLFKIAQELSERNGGAFAPMLGDSDNNLLYKILQLIILGGGTAGTCAADLVACNALTASLQAQLATCLAGICPQSMGVEWTPLVAPIGNFFGFTTGNIDFPGITSITFTQSSSLAGHLISFQASLASLSFPNMTTTGGTGLIAASNAAMTTLLTPSLVSSSAAISITSNPVLTAIAFPALTTLSGGSPSLGITSNTLMASASFPVLATTVSITFTSNPALTALSFPALTSMGAGTLTITGNTVMSTFSAAVLTTVAGSINLGTNVGLTSISFPVLATQTGATSMTFTGDTSLTALSFPSLTSMGTSVNGITATGCTSMTTFSFPLLVVAGRLLVDGCTNLANITLTNYLPTNGRVQNFSAAALTQASVDHVLARCVANAAYVTGTITLSGGTSSTPSAAGLVDKATLQARGCVVNTN